MRPAAIINWEAEHERGMIPVGPRIGVALTPSQLVAVAFCVSSAMRDLVHMIEYERSPTQRRNLLAGLRELLDIARLLGR